MSARRLIGGAALIAVAFFILTALGMPMLMHKDGEQFSAKKDVLLELSFIKEPYTKKILLYFGVVGCKTVCAPTLLEVADLYRSLDAKSDVAVYFVNIDGQNIGAQSFAGSFHDDFHGVDINRSELAKIQKQLDIYYSQPLRRDGDIYHSGHLYLLTHEKEKLYRLSQVYITRPFDIATIKKHISKEPK